MSSIHRWKQAAAPFHALGQQTAVTSTKYNMSAHCDACFSGVYRFVSVIASGGLNLIFFPKGVRHEGEAEGTAILGQVMLC